MHFSIGTFLLLTFVLVLCLKIEVYQATNNHEEAIMARNSSRILVLEKIQIHFEINFDKW